MTDYIEVELRVRRDLEDEVIDTLCHYGVDSFEVVDSEVVKTYLEEKPRWELTDLVYEPSETLTIKCYFTEEGMKWQQLTDQLDHLYGEGVEISAPVTLADRDWSSEWKKHFKPFEVATGIVVKPSWTPYANDERAMIIEIDPGMAFGTGTHETTALCIQEMIHFPMEGANVADVGCGSGILSIAAAKLGARTVLATDIDDKSVETTIENCEMNQVTNVEVAKKDLLKGVDCEFDLIVANLIAEVIVDLAPQATSRIKIGGCFIVSGILDVKEAMVVEALTSSGFEVVNIARKGEWIAIRSVKGRV